MENLYSQFFTLMEQPTYTPELNTLDNSIWVLVKKEMELEVQGWEKQHPTLFWEENFSAFCARARRVALALPEELVGPCLEHSRTVCEKLIAAKGWYIHG